MAGINRIITGEISPKSKGKKYLKEIAAKFSPSAIAAKKPDGKKNK